MHYKLFAVCLHESVHRLYSGVYCALFFVRFFLYQLVMNEVAQSGQKWRLLSIINIQKNNVRATVDYLGPRGTALYTG